MAEEKRGGNMFPPWRSRALILKLTKRRDEDQRHRVGTTSSLKLRFNTHVGVEPNARFTRTARDSQVKTREAVTRAARARER